MAVHVVDAAVGLHQPHGGLFADTGHAGDIVAGVPRQSLQVDHVDGVEAVLLAEAVLGDAAGGVALAAEEPDAGVGRDELEAVPVAGGDHALPALRLAPAADGADEVVRLVAGQLVAGDGHGGQHLLQRQHLLRQLVGHPLAVRLIGGIRRVAERRLPPVKGDAHRLRLFVVQQPLEHGDEAENGVGIQPLPGGQQTRFAHAVEGAVDDAVAVEYHQFHRGASRNHILTTLLYAVFALNTTAFPRRPAIFARSKGKPPGHSSGWLVRKGLFPGEAAGRGLKTPSCPCGRWAPPVRPRTDRRCPCPVSRS